MVEASLPQERSDFYVYVIFRPNGIPCYVGKGRGLRYIVHEYRKNGHHNPHLNNILRNAGGTLPTVRMRWGMTEKEALEFECLMIRIVGREVDGGPLVNLTDGGESPGRINRSQEYRAKQRKSHIGNKLSAETRAKLSAKRKGRKLSDAHKAALGNAFRGKKLSPERVEWIRIMSSRPEQRKALAQRSIGNKYGVGNKRTPEGNAKVAASVAENNRRRSKTGKPTVHKGPTPWIDEGMSRTSWYRKLARQRHERDGGSQEDSGRQLTFSV